MWTSNQNKWPKRQTQLEKFMIERIIQRCDTDEVISEKHRTTNGYTIVVELIKLCELTEKKSRTIKTLQTLINEAVEKGLGQNISSDLIIDKYFIDLKNFLLTYDSSQLGTATEVKLNELRQFKHRLQLHFHQLELEYFNALQREILGINFKVTVKGFNIQAKLLTQYIDLLITFLVFKGYSISSFFEVITRWLDDGYRITPKRILKNFDFSSKQIYFIHRFTGKEVQIVNDFIRILKEKYRFNVSVSFPDGISEFDVSHLRLSPDDTIVYYKKGVLDPHTFIRTLYDDILKDIVALKNRSSLSKFNHFFQYTYWRFSKKGEKYFKQAKLYSDPINVNSRKNTLLITLQRCNKFYNLKHLDKGYLPLVENKQLNSAIFFYNLALGSKSIENSLSLLWTSLESLLPYRKAQSDIESIQYFVSSSLAIGSTSRSLQVFAKRFNETNRNIILGKSNLFEWQSIAINDDELLSFFRKLKSTNDLTGIENVKQLKKQSNLLAYQYSILGEALSSKKLNFLQSRIEKSKKSIIYQLQRIYLHRNQIVHSGEMVNEYTNLWIHLEWYIGKLLFYAVKEIEIQKKSSSLEECFLRLDAESNYLQTYLKLNSETEIKKLSPRIEELLLSYYWQSF